MSYKLVRPTANPILITLPARSGAEPHAAAARLLVLDGWRATSILLVLMCHMLPLGPKRFVINEAAGLAGMSLFFTLSGFLITINLLKHTDVFAFVVRRLCRILPLAYTAIVAYLLIQGKDWRFYVAHFLFLVNYLHGYLTPGAGHLWSLCVEIHFYAFVAVLVLLLGRGGLNWLPLFALGVTAHRVTLGVKSSIVTDVRIDEILAGATLALIWAGELGKLATGGAKVLRLVPLWVWLILFSLSCHPVGGASMYLRPYCGAAVVGHTLLSERQSWWLLRNRGMRYLAEISYALYVIHPLTMYGWLGSGGTVEKYLKRPISFALTFSLAHLSTFHMERHFIAWGKQITRKRTARPASIEQVTEKLGWTKKTAWR